MPGSNLRTRDKGGAIAAVIAIHAALLFAFLHLSGKIELADPQSALQIIDSTCSSRLRLRRLHRKQQARPKPKREGGSAPKNIKSEATAVVRRPKPIVAAAIPIRSAASETPRQRQPTRPRAHPTSAGPGTGAGGSGTGTGSGAGGSGPGGGGDGGVAEPPRLVTPVLRGRDFPSATLDQWPRGATVFMRLRVDARGIVSECTVDRGTGRRRSTPRCATSRMTGFVSVPRSIDSGQAVAGWFGYAQPAPR